jgi:2-methylisocitrate lyase-like PEP mutase family enzyme
LSLGWLYLRHRRSIVVLRLALLAVGRRGHNYNCKTNDQCHKLGRMECHVCLPREDILTWQNNPDAGEIFASLALRPTRIALTAMVGALCPLTLLAIDGAPMSSADKCRIFHALHQSGCFVIPNPWNVGSARYLQSLGFKALATTSSGYAHSQGCCDGALTRDEALAHFREIAAKTDIPLNADFENGHAHEPADVAENVRLCVETGIAGLSIEDFTGDDTHPLYDFELAVTRVRAARQAIDRSGVGVVFTARTEGFIKNRPDMPETIRRLKAFADAGADCLYAPGIKTREQIETVVKAVAPKPVNLLVASPGLSVKEIAAIGVRRISVGGTLARVAMHAFIASAREIAEQGTFDSFASVLSNAELNKFFAGGPLRKS